MRFLPDRKAFAVFLLSADVVAELPVELAGKPYFNTGSTVLATVYARVRRRIILTQRSSLFVRQLSEFVLTPLLQSGHTFVYKAAMVDGANFAKVAVSTQSLSDVLLYLGEAKDYVDYPISAVEWDIKLERRLKNALKPARPELIEKINFIPAENPLRGEVYVKKGNAKRFLGAGGINIATAAKLLGFKIRLIET